MSELKDKFAKLAQGVNNLGQLLDIEAKIIQAKKLQKQSESSNFWQDAKRAAHISKQLADLNAEVKQWQDLKTGVYEAFDLSALADNDQSLSDELDDRYGRLEKIYRSLQWLTLFSGKYDRHSAVMSIYAGAGGDEAQDWVAMLLRMYLRFAEQHGWQANIVAASQGSEAGYKNIVVEIIGKYAYGKLQSESGVHRLVRLSPFDADHARHTSFAMVDILPELEADDSTVEIDPKDIRIDTFRASGKGGQKVNKTDSAVRVVHEPTGIIVVCQNERSQAQNKETALRILRSKLQILEDEKQEEAKRVLQGELTEAAWGNQIRSYVLHPYKMVKDHRTDLVSKDPQAVLDGNLDEFIDAYLKYKAKPNAQT
ncbi:MAG: peptide chain release factor 2 [Candidatus Komeilibacteria bacterium]